MLRDYAIVGVISKSRTKGTLNKQHKSVCKLLVPAHGSYQASERYISFKQLPQLTQIIRDYTIRGVFPKIIPLHGKTVNEVMEAARVAAMPRGNIPTEIPSVAIVNPLLGTPKPQPQLIIPFKAKKTTPGEIARQRAKTYKKPSSVKQVGKQKVIDERARAILKEMDGLDEKMADLKSEISSLFRKANNKKKKGQSGAFLESQARAKTQAYQKLVAQYRDLAVELSKRPLGYRLAEIKRLKSELYFLQQDAQDKLDADLEHIAKMPSWTAYARKKAKAKAKKEYEAWAEQKTARVLRFRIDNLEGEGVETKPAGGYNISDAKQGHYIKIAPVNENIDVDPTEDPIGYALTEGWKAQKDKKKGDATIRVNEFTSNEHKLLLDTYQPIADRILWKRVWKFVDYKGWFAQFPELSKDEEFKDEIQRHGTYVILNAAAHYTPDVAKEKLDKGITFPSYLKATLEGEFKKQFVAQIKNIIATGKNVQGIDPEQLLEDDDRAPVAKMGERKFLSPEQYAQVRDVEHILSSKLSPSHALVLTSRLNLYNMSDHTAAEHGLKSWDEVAQDMQERFGRSTGFWKKRVQKMWNVTVHNLGTKDSTMGLTDEQKSALRSGLVLIASVLGSRRSDLLTAAFRRKKKGGKEVSVEVPRNIDIHHKLNLKKPLDAKIAQRMSSPPPRPSPEERFGLRPHVSFWSRDDMKDLADTLALHLPSTPPIEGAPAGTPPIPHPFDIRNFTAKPNTVVPPMIALQDERMKRAYNAYDTLKKIPPSKIKAYAEVAAKRLEKQSTDVDEAKEHASWIREWDEEHSEKYESAMKISDKAKREAALAKIPPKPQPLYPHLRAALDMETKVGPYKVHGLTPWELRAIADHLSKRKVSKFARRIQKSLRPVVLRLVNEHDALIEVQRAASSDED